MTSGKYKEGSGIGTYTVVVPDSAKFEYVFLEAAIPRRYVIERVEIKIEGRIARHERELWLTTPAGNRWLLRNRPKKDEKDAPPDVVATIDEALKKGHSQFRIEGEATTMRDRKTLVRLATAEVAEKKP